MTDVLEQTTLIQRKVGDPFKSAWVSANAGTGKTYVLVRRVIRQLLAGARPSSIICITYTKAAASEMSERLLGMLSRWTLVDDDELSSEIAQVTGTAPGSDDLIAARRLFAQALETPGGLKIQTIHSLCASVLSRFPIEAGLPLGFRPLEDDEAHALLHQAVEKVADLAAHLDHPLHEQMRRVCERFPSSEENGGSFQLSLEATLRSYSHKTRGLASLNLDDPGHFLSLLREGIGLMPDETIETVNQSFRRGLDRAFLRELAGMRPGAKKRLTDLIDAIEDWFEREDFSDCLEKNFVMTDKGTIKSLKHISKQLEPYEPQWRALFHHITEHRDRFRALRLFEANIDFAMLAIACLRQYQVMKEGTGSLDYEDLVDRTLMLLSQTDQAWVAYKLDSGIDHVLLDEAQDSPPSQWKLFSLLVDDMGSTSAEAADSRMRSFFVVGDPKQSIYAFNGADAALFSAMQSRFEGQLGSELVSDSLFVSFRTAAPVLRFVDEVFDNDPFRLLAGGYHRHAAAHTERSGSVTVWPGLPDPDVPVPDVWNLPVDQQGEDSIDRQLALALADDIAGKLKIGEALSCREGRSIAAHDIMILFQRRGTRFREVIRALSERGIPCAGTDRIDVANDIAVRDLIALLRFACNRDDNLSLAVLLKSPFFGWSDGDLFDLASERQETVLWRELGRRCGERLDWTRVRDELQRVLDEGARYGPYRMLSGLLDGGDDATGRTRLHRRLGSQYREATEAFLREALRFEDSEPRSLHGFLLAAERLQRDLKRQVANDEAGGVRVMTVHGAKGLEAPMVYLADADHRQAAAQQRRTEPLLVARSEDGLIPILRPSSGKDETAALEALSEDYAEKQYEEYQRLLYVAATRAEEHLVVCGGKEPKQSSDHLTWHQLSVEAMKRVRQLDGTVTEEPGPFGPLYSIRTPIEDDDAGTARPAEPTVALETPGPPAWINQPAVKEAANPVIYPSEQPDTDEKPGRLVKVGAAGGDARQRGVFMHRLLEKLPEVRPADRADLAARLSRPFREVLSPTVFEELSGAAIALLEQPWIAPLFEAGSQPEVSLQGEIAGVMVSGQIDRLHVTADEVWLAEYKSGRWVPQTGEDIPDVHRKQVAAYRELLQKLYPGRAIRAVLIYTAAGRAWEV